MGTTGQPVKPYTKDNVQYVTVQFIKMFPSTYGNLAYLSHTHRVFHRYSHVDFISTDNDIIMVMNVPFTCRPAWTDQS